MWLTGDNKRGSGVCGSRGGLTVADSAQNPGRAMHALADERPTRGLGWGLGRYLTLYNLSISLSFFNIQSNAEAPFISHLQPTTSRLLIGPLQGNYINRM
jgi:hypothetical protein